MNDEERDDIDEPTDDESIDEEVREEFEDAQSLGTGAESLGRKLREHSTGPEISAGDLDAAWDQPDGDETAGATAPTPDQDVVDEIGEALGVSYEPDEPIRPGEKERERDLHRWEKDPVSSEDYEDRIEEERADSA